MVGSEFLEHAVDVLSRAFDGGQPRLFVVLDAVGQRQRVADGRLHCASSAPTSSLLVRHADGALEHGPGVAVGGIQKVKHFTREVQRSALIEVFGVVGANVSLTLALPWRDDLVVRFCGRGEVIGAVDALFMEVHVHLRHPLTIERRSGLGFALRLPSEIPVHVKQEVVGPTAWPRFVVFPSIGIRVGSRGGGHVLEMHVTIAAVWVHARIQNHNGLLQQGRMGGGQRLHRRHGRLGTDGFVAVHVVAQVHPNHSVPAVDPFIDAQRVVRLEHVQALHVARG